MAGYYLGIAAVVVGVVCLRALFRKRVSPRWIHALWLAVLLRMLIPVSLPLELAVLPPVESPGQISLETVEKPRPIPPTLSGVSPTASAVTAAPSVPQVQEERRLGWEELRWLGTGAVALWFTVSGGLFWLSLRKERIPDGKIGVLKVYRTPRVGSPCLAGLVPAVYLGRTYLPEEERELVLQHEYCHFLRGDPLWALVRTAAVCLFWFHPAVWLAAYYSKLDGELACDDAVCARMDGPQRLQYANCLINASQTPQRFALPWGGSPMKERIRMVTKQRKKNVGFVILALILTLCMVGCSLMEVKPVPAEASHIQEKTEEKAPVSSQKQEPPASSKKKENPPVSSTQGALPPVSTAAPVGPAEAAVVNGSYYCRWGGRRLHLNFDRAAKQLRIEEAEGNGELVPCLSGSYEESKEGDLLVIRAELTGEGKAEVTLEFSLLHNIGSSGYYYSFRSVRGEEGLLPSLLQGEQALSFVTSDILHYKLGRQESDGRHAVCVFNAGLEVSLQLPEGWYWEWGNEMVFQGLSLGELDAVKRVEFFANATVESVKQSEWESGNEDTLWDKAVTGTSDAGVSYLIAPERYDGFPPYGDSGRRHLVFVSLGEHHCMFTVNEYQALDSDPEAFEKTVEEIAKSISLRAL